MKMWREMREREAGTIHPKKARSQIEANRISDLQLSNHKDVLSPHKGSINSLQIDLTEGRYLLSGASDASVAVFDIQRPSNSDGDTIATHSCVFAIDKQHADGHKYAISSAVWYPIDTGVFVTASYDHAIKAWDTNTTQVVMNFKLRGRVNSIAMSSVATSHMLIAAGSDDVQVRLCDISSGAFSHTLSGHRGTVMSVAWSTSSEWVLISGGCDGSIRFWDIRRAGCFQLLDQSKCQLGRRLPVRSRSSFNSKVSSNGNSSTMSLENKNSPPVSRSKRLLKGQTPLKRSTTLRLHPGMTSSLDRGIAHYGNVTGLKVTDDGMYLLSAGSDSRIRLWDMESYCNTLVNFETRLQPTKSIQLATTHDSSVVFVPCYTTIKVYNVWSGTTLTTFHGHYEQVNCCCFNSQVQELYSGSQDRQILVWTPSRSIPVKDAKTTEDEDNWSD